VISPNLPQGLKTAYSLLMANQLRLLEHTGATLKILIAERRCRFHHSAKFVSQRNSFVALRPHMVA